MKVFYPNRRWAQLTVGFLAILAVLNLFFLNSSISLYAIYFGFLALLFLSYKTWTDWTYININEEEKILKQASTSLYSKQYNILAISKIAWSGSSLDGVKIIFDDPNESLTLSPALYDKETLRSLLREVVSINPNIELNKTTLSMIGK